MTAVIKNKLEKVKKTVCAGKFCRTLIILIGVWILTILGCTHSSGTIFYEKNLLDPISICPDSINVDFIFNPERWNLSDDILWVIDSRQTPFLTGFDLNKMKTVCSFGNIGQGPKEYICPGIIEGEDAAPTIYSNTLNKIDRYQFAGDSLHIVEYGSLPLTINHGQLPNPYTRIARINDSIYAGTYFFPEEIGIDLIDWRKGDLISKIPLSVDQSEGSMSGPYELKLAASDSFIVIAYRYIDLIEIYSFEHDSSLSLVKLIGNNTTQRDLYELDRDDEMIKYYSDIACVNDKAYLLYQGVPEGMLPAAKTFLEIYSLRDGKNIKNISLGGYFDQLQVNKLGSDVYLHSPNNEDHIYHVHVSL